jgi:hypothetical protein
MLEALGLIPNTVKTKQILGSNPSAAKNKNKKTPKNKKTKFQSSFC